jgi:uncharacterized BrkB/YihY/UPF0761 family membrane protein
MLYFLGSIVLAMMIGIVSVSYFGPDALPPWVDGLFWGTLGAGALVRFLEITVFAWYQRAGTRHPLRTSMRRSDAIEGRERVLSVD